MTSSEEPQSYADRTYRPAAGVAGGVLLLALCLWLGGDAVIRGEGNTPWLALAGLLMAVPLVIAFTVRPVASASDDRLLVRNPFRTITAPWAAVETVRTGYSTELFAGGRKFQVWAVPVSLRARKKAAHRTVRASGAPSAPGSRDAAGAPGRAWSDGAADELRELAEKNAGREGAQGEVTVRWAYEIIAPVLAGAVVLAVLVAIG